MNEAVVYWLTSNNNDVMHVAIKYHIEQGI